MTFEAEGDAGAQEGLARAKAGIYGLLARVFGAVPSSELVKAMKTGEMVASLAGFGVSFAEDFLAGDDESTAEGLAQEYTRLFTGPGKHIAAFESVYAPGEAEPRLWGKATAEVAEFYRELGIGIPEGRTPDHLSLELEAMAVMAQAQATRIAAGDEAAAARFARMQQRFCREHLLRWVPAVCSDVKRETGSSFYRSMADLAAGLVEMTCGGGGNSGNIQEEEALNENT